MASIARDKNGYRRILFVAPDGRRPTIRLGKVSQRVGRRHQGAVEQLLEALCSAGRWKATWPNGWRTWNRRLAKKLARVGLIPNPEAKPAATLGPFLKATSTAGPT